MSPWHRIHWGPLQWGRLPKEAETTRPRPAPTRSRCFNGAASRRRRRHLDRAGRGTRSLRGFNGAASRRRRRHTGDRITTASDPRWLQWGRLPKEAETGRGAAHRHLFDHRLQWGRLPKEAETDSVSSRRCRDEASMGPPPEGGGDVRDGMRLSSRVRFNGAASRRRRRQDHIPNQRPADLASMGPPPEGGGDAGHSAPRPPSPASLQWGRLPKEAETDRVSGGGGQCLTCFNGAASRRRRRPADPSGINPSDTLRFNGAASRRRRRRRS